MRRTVFLLLTLALLTVPVCAVQLPGELLDALPEEAAALVPLYIASELYKEDDLSMATMWRNEYEDGLEKLRQAYAATGGGIRPGRIRNTTGWW